MLRDTVKLYLTKSADLVCEDPWGGSSHLWKGGGVSLSEWWKTFIFNIQM